MRLEHGGKLELRLEATSDERAVYGVLFVTPSGEWRGAFHIGAERGEVELHGFAEGLPPPSWLVADARAALRAAHRNRGAAGPWPRRITRWRPEPVP